MIMKGSRWERRHWTSSQPLPERCWAEEMSYVISQCYEHPSSRCCRVTILFFSVLIFPVAAISVAALLAKGASLPSLWQKKIVTEQSETAFKTFEAFQKAFDERKLDQALEIYRQHPKIKGRSKLKVDYKLFKIANWKINEGISWEKVPNYLSPLSTIDRIRLIDHAVKERLKRGTENSQWTLSSKQIEDLMRRSLGSIETIADCWEHLTKNSLSLKTEERNVITDALKIHLSLPLINQVFARKYTDSGLKKAMIDSQIAIWAFDPGTPYFLLVNDQGKLKRLNFLIQQIKISQGSALGARDFEAGKIVEVDHVLQPIERLKRMVNPETKAFLENQCRIVRLLTALVKAAESKDVDQVSIIKDDLERILPKQNELYINMWKTGEITYNQSENVVAVLQQKLSASLLEVFELIKSSLIRKAAEISIEGLNSSLFIRKNG